MDSLSKFLKLGSAFAKENFAIAFRVLFERKEFIRSLEHNSNSEFYRAIVYAIFLSLVDLITMIPSLRSAGVNTESISFLLVNTLVMLFSITILGAVNYILCLILRARITLRSSIVLTIYLSTVTVLLNFFTIPINSFVGRLIIRGSFTDEISFQVLQSSDKPMYILGLLSAMFIGLVYWAVIQAGSFRLVTRIGWLRTVLFGSASIISMFALSELLIGPMMAGHYGAFIAGKN